MACKTVLKLLDLGKEDKEEPRAHHPGVKIAYALDQHEQKGTRLGVRLGTKELRRLQ